MPLRGREKSRDTAGLLRQTRVLHHRTYLSRSIALSILADSVPFGPDGADNAVLQPGSQIQMKDTETEKSIIGQRQDLNGLSGIQQFRNQVVCLDVSALSWARVLISVQSCLKLLGRLADVKHLVVSDKGVKDVRYVGQFSQRNSYTSVQHRPTPNGPETIVNQSLHVLLPKSVRGQSQFNQAFALEVAANA